jgi:Holliday junction resolvase
VTSRQSHKRRGAKWETDLVTWFRERGLTANRLARTGREDEGDVEFSSVNGMVLIEAKAPGESGRMDLSGWMKEAVVEAGHYAKHRNQTVAPLPVVVIKARGKSIEDAYVVMRLEDAVARL